MKIMKIMNLFLITFYQKYGSCTYTWINVGILTLTHKLHPTRIDGVISVLALYNYNLLYLYLYFIFFPFLYFTLFPFFYSISSYFILSYLILVYILYFIFYSVNTRTFHIFIVPSCACNLAV